MAPARHSGTDHQSGGSDGAADIVVGYGRSILEAIACGVAYVHEHSGSDGWVTAENYARRRRTLPAPQAVPTPASRCCGPISRPAPTSVSLGTI
jgi:hypothetical protein